MANRTEMEGGRRELPAHRATTVFFRGAYQGGFSAARIGDE